MSIKQIAGAIWHIKNTLNNRNMCQYSWKQKRAGWEGREICIRNSLYFASSIIATSEDLSERLKWRRLVRSEENTRDVSHVRKLLLLAWSTAGSKPEDVSQGGKYYLVISVSHITQPSLCWIIHKISSRANDSGLLFVNSYHDIGTGIAAWLTN